MIEQTCTRGETVAETVTSWVGRPLSDPFASQLVVVPGPGHARWLSQEVARRWGITAGIEFLTFGQWQARLRGDLGIVPEGVDPWSVQALALTLTEILTGLRDDPTRPAWADVLVAHLQPEGDDAGADSPARQPQDRPGRVWSTAHRVARLFRRYCELEPSLVHSWTAGHAEGVDGRPLAELQRWQFELWRECVERLGSDHPRAQFDRLVRRLPHLVSPWERVFVVGVGEFRPDDRVLISALSSVVELGCMRLVTSAEQSSTGDVAASTPEQPVLSRFQSLLLTGEAVAGHGDMSVQLLRSHGLNRQVEVLREALCGILEDDPSLEPRDVVIVCPDLPAAAPLLEATFGSRDHADAHPGHRLRVQVPHLTGAGHSAGSAGPVHEVLAHLFDLTIGRATAEDLNTLVALPPVSRRFDFSSDDHSRIRDLLERARLRWGLDGEARAELGLPGVSQGTWLNAVERMVTGATYAERPLTWLGTALPIPHVEAGDLRLIGQVAELVSRVRWLDKEFRKPASPEQWADRLRAAIDRFIELPWDQQWAATATRAAITRWASAAPSQALLDQHDVRQVVADLASSWRSRPAFGNGAMQVVGLDDLIGIPHRVVAIVGLDDGAFPHRRQAWGDDLLAQLPQDERTEGARGEPNPGDRDRPEDARARSQRALLTTLLSARERLVVVYQGTDPRTGATVEPPVAITQLTSALQKVAPFRHRDMPLQPHSPVNFVSDPEMDETAFSFDRQALAAARAMAEAHQHPSDPPPPPEQWRFPRLNGGSVALADVISFWRHPARAMLKQAIGTSFVREDRALPLQVPMELYGLTEYSVGQAALEHLLAGATREEAMAAARLDGEVPPGQLGQAALKRTLDNAEDLAERAMAHRGIERDVPISLDLGRWQLSGVVRCQNDVVQTVSYGRQSGVTLVSTWLNLLAVSVEQDTPMRARSLHLDSRHLMLQAPSPARCRDLLVDLLDWRGSGMESILLAPLRLLYLVEMRKQDQPSDERTRLEASIGREFRSLGKDADWRPFLPASQRALLGSPVHAHIPLTVAEFGERVLSPITKAMVQA